MPNALTLFKCHDSLVEYTSRGGRADSTAWDRGDSTPRHSTPCFPNSSWLVANMRDLISS